jgi:hypothetical protein
MAAEPVPEVEPTPDEWSELWDAILDVASASPLKRHPTTFATAVPWTRIERLRAALDAVRVEWRNR